MKTDEPGIGIIGGSGLYQMEGFHDPQEHHIETPFGLPSDAIVGGEFAGRSVYFLPRHGRGHRLLPHELNHRANIYALRLLGVRWIICVTAVGSLQEQYAPRDIFCLRSFTIEQPAYRSHLFWERDRSPHQFCRTDLYAFAQSDCRNGRVVRHAGA
jgi:5'-methylthioadenosine phosphorylase